MILPDILLRLDGFGFRVITALLSILWQSTILLGAAGLLSFLLRNRSAAARHTVWTAAVLAIPFLPLLSKNMETRGSLPVEVAILPLYEKPISIAFDTVPSVSGMASNPVISYRFSPWDYPWTLLLMGYSGIVFCVLTWTAIGHLRLRRWLVKGGSVLDGSVVDVFHQAGKKLGIIRQVPILEHSEVFVPLTCGILRPAIILPAGFSEAISDSELRTVALHELAHVQRRDTLIFTVISLIRAVFFFQPLLWIAARQIVYLAEVACDSSAMKHESDPAAYAQFLTRIAAGLPSKLIPPEAAAGILFSRSMFFRRIREILSNPIGKIRKVSRWTMTGISGAGILCLLIAGVFPLTVKGKEFAVAMSLGTTDYEKMMILPFGMLQKNSPPIGLFEHTAKLADMASSGITARPDSSAGTYSGAQGAKDEVAPQAVSQQMADFDYEHAIKIAKYGDDLLRTARGKIRTGTGDDKKTIFYKYDHASGRLLVTFDYPDKPENPFRMSLLYDGEITTTLSFGRQSTIAFTNRQFKLEESVFNPFLFEYFFYGKGISEILASRKIKLSGSPVGDLTYTKTVKMGNLDVDVFSIFSGGYEAFSLYLARQYLYRPVKMSINDKNGREVCVETCEYTKIGNGMFFPVKACDKLDGIHGNDIEFVIGETEINVPLSDDDFKLDIPDGVKVTDFRKANGGAN